MITYVSIYIVSVLIVLYGNRLFRARYGDDFLPEGDATLVWPLNTRYFSATIWPMFLLFVLGFFVFEVVKNSDKFLQNLVKKTPNEKS